MIEEISVEITDKVEDFPELKKNYTEIPLEKSIDSILAQINLDIIKILKYNII
jgi:hypothetical protein